MMTLLAHGCFAQRLRTLSRMSASIVPGKQYVTAGFLLTGLRVKSPTKGVVGEAAEVEVQKVLIVMEQMREDGQRRWKSLTELE